MLDKDLSDRLEAIYGPLGFLDAAEANVVDIQEDASGKSYAVIQYPFNYAQLPASAQVRETGDATEVSVRLRWSDDTAFVAPRGEIRIVTSDKLGVDISHFIKAPLSAFVVPLPSKPVRVVLV